MRWAVVAMVIGMAVTANGQQLINDLKTLTVEQAESLAQRKGDLSLNGLTTLSDEIANALAQKKGNLFLNGLTTLSDQAAAALAQHQGRLGLIGLTKLSDQATKSLSQHKGALGLNGLTMISKEAAKALAQHRGGLSLNGLTTLSDETAAALAEYNDWLSLDGLTTISVQTAARLAEHEGELSLSGLTSLSAETATALAQHNGKLSLNGLTTISTEAAEALANKKDTLYLNGLTKLSDGVAASLARYNGPLILNGVTELSLAAAKSLSSRASTTSLAGLKKLSQTSLMLLRARHAVLMPDSVSVSGSESLEWHTNDEKVFQGSPLRQEYDNEAKEIAFIFTLEAGGTVKVPKSQLSADQRKTFAEIQKASRLTAEKQAQEEKAVADQIAALRKRRASLAARLERIQQFAQLHGSAPRAMSADDVVAFSRHILTTYEGEDHKLALGMLQDPLIKELAAAIRNDDVVRINKAARAIDSRRLAVLEKLVLSNPPYGLLSVSGDSTPPTMLNVLEFAAAAPLYDIEAQLQALQK